MKRFRPYLGGSTAAVAGVAAVASSAWSPIAGSVLAGLSGGLRVLDIYLSRQDLERVTKEVLAAIGGLFKNRARITLHLAKGETLVHHPLRWVPLNGCVAAKDKKRKALSSGLAWDLAFDVKFRERSSAGSGRIPDEHLASIQKMHLWHQQNSNIKAEDAANLSEYMCKVKQIECIKLSDKHQKSLGVVTIDILEPISEEPVGEASLLCALLATFLSET